MRGAGVRQFGGIVEVLELPGPRGLRPDEVLIDVQACGVGNWDEFARTGGWDLGIRPPMALGVEAAGLVDQHLIWPQLPRPWQLQDFHCAAEPAHART